MYISSLAVVFAASVPLFHHCVALVEYSKYILALASYNVASTISTCILIIMIPKFTIVYCHILLVIANALLAILASDSLREVLHYLY